MPVPSLDLFSGAGGFAFALQQVLKPVAYCEIDEFCRQLLVRKMRQGVLPAAEVFPDVRSLTVAQLKARPRVITAGFPCQDISSQNNFGQGLAGDRSGLVAQVVRLARELPSVTHVLMENSPMIQTRGLAQLQKAFAATGFSLQWKIISAADCGAPHERKRWWCLASRGAALQRVEIRLMKTLWSSGKEPCARLIRRKDGPSRTWDRKTIQLLGSAVVPLVVQVAWNTLAVSGYVMPPFKPKFTALKLQQGSIVYLLRTWATPLNNSGSSLTQNNVLTFRASRALSNQIYFGTRTNTVNCNKKLCETYDINPRFIEYLMGYPLGYTHS